MSRLRRTSPVSADRGPRPASVMWQKNRFRSLRRLRGAREVIPASVMSVSARLSLCQERMGVEEGAMVDSIRSRFRVWMLGGLSTPAT